MNSKPLSADFNPSPETPSKQMVNDFFAAVEKGDAGRAQDLLEFFPALAEWRDSTQATALVIAARNGHTAIVEALLKGGADIHAEDAGGMNALCYAAYYGQQDTCAFLIREGADPAQTGKFRASAIDLARAGDFPSLSDYLRGEADRKIARIKAAWNATPSADVELARPVQTMKRITFKPKN